MTLFSDIHSGGQVETVMRIRDHAHYLLKIFVAQRSILFKKMLHFHVNLKCQLEK